MKGEHERKKYKRSLRYHRNHPNTPTNSFVLRNKLWLHFIHS